MRDPSTKVLAVVWLVLAAVMKAAALDLVAHWHMNETGPIYADAGPLAVTLLQDAGTTASFAQPGIEGNAALLHIDSPPVSTRLHSSHPALQRDSFGFSFWIRPISVNAFDTILAKEMTFDNTVPDDERMAWQVHVLNNNGSGLAPLELLVRGDDRGAGSFFGSATSAAVVPLQANTSVWIHVAGGYDAVSGRLSLFVNGIETSTQGAPGARSSDGGALAIGTAKNGGDTVAFAASALIEDVQIYDGSLWLEDVEYLRNNPGTTLAPDFMIRQTTRESDGDVTVRFDSLAGGLYQLEAASTFTGFVSIATHDSSIDLLLDNATTGPWTVAGHEGDSVLLRWDDPPGISTRLYAPGPRIQSDSFGFSLWIRPAYLNPGDNIIAKEMAFNNAVPNWSRIAWQVHVLNDNGGGSAPIELVVRGDNRATTNFYGLVQSSATVPLHADSSAWIHLAGGYDAVTGELRLFVNGAGSAVTGVPGAHNSDGSPLAIGTVRNGADAVQFAASARIDDLQLYNRPVTAQQAAWLATWPGFALADAPRMLARWKLNEPYPPYLDSAKAYGFDSVRLPAATLNGLGTAEIFLRLVDWSQPGGFEACE